jgi:hypothetical protein
MVLFIVVGVLFVGALIFAIFSFTGKSSAEDDKDKAQKELASTKDELGTTKARARSWATSSAPARSRPTTSRRARTPGRQCRTKRSTS